MLFLANPAERWVLAQFALKPIPGTVRVMAFKGLYSDPKPAAEGVVVDETSAFVVRPSKPTGGVTTYARCQRIECGWHAPMDDITTVRNACPVCGGRVGVGA